MLLMLRPHRPPFPRARRTTVLRPFRARTITTKHQAYTDNTQGKVGEYSPTEGTKPKGASFLGFIMVVVVASISDSPLTIVLRRSTSGAGPRSRSLPAASRLRHRRPQQDVVHDVSNCVVTGDEEVGRVPVLGEPSVLRGRRPMECGSADVVGCQRQVLGALR
jgi:hypothetical protein